MCSYYVGSYLKNWKFLPPIVELKLFLVYIHIDFHWGDNIEMDKQTPLGGTIYFAVDGT